MPKHKPINKQFLVMEAVVKMIRQCKARGTLDTTRLLQPTLK